VFKGWKPTGIGEEVSWRVDESKKWKSQPTTRGQVVKHSTDTAGVLSADIAITLAMSLPDYFSPGRVGGWDGS